MKRVLGFTILCLVLGTSSVAADRQAKGKKNGKSNGAVAAASHAEVQVVFGRGEVTILREHYAPRYRSLPPGLQKKLARGGQLPPGWQKKFEPFPAAVERKLTVLPGGYRRGVIDGHAVIYSSRTNVIVDIAVLF